MQVLLAVIDDLYQFARTALFGIFFEQKTSADSYVNFHTEYSPQLPLLEQETIHQAHHALLPKTGMTFVQGEQYFIGVAHTFLYTDPVVAFDSVVMELPYGELVYVQKLGGRWAHIKTQQYQGWVLKDVLAEQSRDVFPVFAEDILYDAMHPEVQKLRLCIDDAFGGTHVSVPLADVEYVTYKLTKKNKHIPWTSERPRTSGTWQKKLRGVQGIHMSVTPKTDSIMEYVRDDIGHVCYVEAVFPDETLKINGVGLYTEGFFTELMLGKKEWIELRPVFIEVT